MADIEAVQAPGGQAHAVRGFLGEEVLRRIRPGPDAMLFAEAPLLLEALLLPVDAMADGGHNPERYVPLYEAKMIHQFDHRWTTYDGTSSRDVTAGEKADPSFEPTPRYWVPEHEVRDRLAAKGWNRGWVIGWRDIARATDERTVIAAALSKFELAAADITAIRRENALRLYPRFAA